MILSKRVTFSWKKLPELWTVHLPLKRSHVTASIVASTASEHKSTMRNEERKLRIISFISSKRRMWHIPEIISYIHTIPFRLIDSKNAGSNPLALLECHPKNIRYLFSRELLSDMRRAQIDWLENYLESKCCNFLYRLFLEFSSQFTRIQETSCIVPRTVATFSFCNVFC